MAGALQLGAIGLMILGSIIATIATLSNDWAKSDVSKEVLESVRRSWGLWMRCQHVAAGLNTCDHYDRLILGSPIELILSRAFMLMGVICGAISIALGLAGADCATVIKQPSKKKKTRCVSGIIGCVGGGLILVTGILIAIIIVNDFHQQNYYVTMQQGGLGRGRRAGGDDLAPIDADYVAEITGSIQRANCDEAGNCTPGKGERFGSNMRNDGQTMVFGSGVMLAWGAGIMMLIAGGLMLSQGCGGTTYEEEHQYNDGYSQGQNTYNQPKTNRQNNEYL